MSTRNQSLGPLTRMERRVGRLISLGYTVKQVAVILDRSESTVDNHKSKVMKKLGVHNTAALTRCMIRDGISPLHDALTAEELRSLEASGLALAAVDAPSRSAIPGLSQPAPIQLAATTLA